MTDEEEDGTDGGVASWDDDVDKEDGAATAAALLTGEEARFVPKIPIIID